MRIDINKSRVQDSETVREKALRERVEKLEAKIEEMSKPKEPVPAPKK